MTRDIASKFQWGSQKVEIRGEKRYYPVIMRHGQRKYSRLYHFKKATSAQEFAKYWAMRMERFLASLHKKEVEHVD